MTQLVAPSIPAPRTVLRIACAGSRNEEAGVPAVGACAGVLFDELTRALRFQNQGAGAPHLQLLTGLADGADQTIAAVFLDGHSNDATREHVAVLPFDEVTYLDRSPIADRARYERLTARSSLVIELDGRWVADDDARGTSFARRCRSRAYRAQGRLMTQRADLLLAVFDPDAEVRPGGTAETVRYALEVKIPVLVLAIGDGRSEPTLHLLRSVPELEALNRWGEGAAAAPADWQPVLTELISELAPVPPALEALPRRSPLDGLWTRFERQFGSLSQSAPRGAEATVAEQESPFHALRSHSSTLNARLAGRYRGGFLTNFRFAAIATTLAAASLGLMVVLHESIHDDWMLATLILLATAKLILVVVILAITRYAHQNQWNERAIGARYLAENLRLMYWLPALGPLRAPQPSALHSAGGEQRPHTADALFQAHVRAAPALTGVWLQAKLPGQPARGTIKARHAIETLRDRWIASQCDYHTRNWQRLAALCDALDSRVKWMNLVVIGCVALDIVALSAVAITHQSFAGLDAIKAILVVLAAALPAAVSATNGIREQSEARRLSHRSRQLELAFNALHTEADDAINRIDATTGSPADHGSWVLESLAMADRCTMLVAKDLAEWSLLYGKEMPEP